jgi:hypothetical protein
MHRTGDDVQVLCCVVVGNALGRSQRARSYPSQAVCFHSRYGLLVRQHHEGVGLEITVPFDYIGTGMLLVC